MSDAIQGQPSTPEGKRGPSYWRDVQRQLAAAGAYDDGVLDSAVMDLPEDEPLDLFARVMEVLSDHSVSVDGDSISGLEYRCRECKRLDPEEARHHEARVLCERGLLRIP